MPLYMSPEELEQARLDYRNLLRRSRLRKGLLEELEQARIEYHDRLKYYRLRRELYERDLDRDLALEEIFALLAKLDEKIKHLKR